jgi:hypothetical protein
MHLVRILATIGLGASLTSTGAAQTSRELLQACQDFLAPRSSRDMLRQGQCLGIIQGLTFLDGAVCVPPSVTYEQILRVVISHLENAPDRLDSKFGTMALEAINGVWRCSR